MYGPIKTSFRTIFDPLLSVTYPEGTKYQTKQPILFQPIYCII